jgi:hypothetical protein
MNMAKCKGDGLRGYSSGQHGGPVVPTKMVEVFRLGTGVGSADGGPDAAIIQLFVY